MLNGCITALVTPFKSGKVDYAGLAANVRFQIEAGVDGVLVCGSTGETPTLSPAEWEKSVEAVRAALNRVSPKEKAAGAASSRPLMVVGAGTNSTAKSIRQARLAERLKADALLVVAPYYNKPTQEGLYRHFRAVAESVSIPVIVYNIPPRSVVNVTPATIERLARDCSNLVAVKEASGSLDQVSEILTRCRDRVTVLSGDDSLTLPMMAVGAKGVISVVSNVAPQETRQMVAAMLRGRVADARRIHWRLFPLIKALFVETNPGPVKAAMEMLGMAAGEPRLPLVRPSETSLQLIRQALLDFGLKPALGRA